MENSKENMHFYIGRKQWQLVYAPINSKVQQPSRATPRAFELLKIGLVKFPPLWAKKAAQMSHQLVLNFFFSKTNFVFNQTLYTPFRERYAVITPSNFF